MGPALGVINVGDVMIAGVRPRELSFSGALQALKKAEPPEQSSDLRGCFLKFLSASGRGSEELVLTNDGKEDPEKSRRVIFKIRVRSMEQRRVVTLLGG